MKKFSALFLTFALLLALAVPAMAAGGEYLVDDADLLSSAEERALTKALKAVSKECRATPARSSV